jgi:hypothetical protein
MANESTRRLEARAASFDVGECLGLGFSVWAKNLPAFATIAAVVLSPLLLYQLLIGSRTIEAEDPAAQATATQAAVLLLGGWVLSTIATGAMTYGVVQQLRGQPAGLGACVTVGLSRLPAVMLVGLLVGLCILIGFVLLIVPGLVVMCMLWVSVPVAVIEKPGVSASLSRSSALTRGSRWSIFVILLLIGILQGVAGFLIQTTLLDTGTVYVLVSFLVGNVLGGSLLAVVNAVGYWLLRSRKEGASIEDLARVFD